MAKLRSIALIGPMAAGKSSVSRLLAQALEQPYVEADAHRWEYYEEIGYDHQHVKQIMEEGGGYPEMFAYWKPFEVHLVERLVEDFPDAILDFGAGHSVHAQPEHFDRVKRALAQCSEVVLLLPDRDKRKSLKILNTRLAEVIRADLGTVPQEALDQNREFLDASSNEKLASMIVYTGSMLPDEICREILDRVNKQN